ncbi:hypothetical protein CVT25_007378 [Psilocybe cyanescens]|uniref:Heme haloperoxidase family profile domain-containing protein n=1 Tax=Psilocybe cyanescens TaxID=93625 RepID=A0A409XJ90_PSICY|nr:hypothetical protein CVT25_007378 [Psilocybe cyanescens]
MFLITPLLNFILTVLVFTWDFGLAVANTLLPKLKAGQVTPKGKPGEGGKWPAYVAPKEGDSRCGCPALNALANHGIIAHDGKNIKFTDITSTVRTTFNIGAPISYYVPRYAANMVKKSYAKDTFDLAELNLVPNGIEHDASFLRADGTDPGTGPHLEYIQELLALASTKDKDGNLILTLKDIREYSTKRRMDARALNPGFSLSLSQTGFASNNASTLLSIFGGRTEDLDPFLREERFPAGWESRVRSRFGLSFAAFNWLGFLVEVGISEKRYRAKGVVAAGADSAAASAEDRYEEEV